MAIGQICYPLPSLREGSKTTFEAPKASQSETLSLSPESHRSLP